MAAISLDNDPTLSAGKSLVDGFVASRRRYPTRTAIVTRQGSQTYEELALAAGRIATLLRQADRPEPLLGAVLAARSPIAYQGVLGTLLSGAGYVPLNPKFPAARNLQMLVASGARTVVADESCAALLKELLAGVESPLLVVMPNAAELAPYREAFPRHEFLGAADVQAAEPVEAPPETAADAIAYLLFTSGSTGTPKGVMVSHGNVRHYLACMQQRYELNPDDRCSQTFDLTFDLSVHDMFMTWQCGASLICPSQNDLMVPSRFVREHEVTVWFSVPSVAVVMGKLGQLKPGAFPALRWSLFCGEPLTENTAAAWQSAAPNSIVENLYGPTEVTIACTVERWQAPAADAPHDGVVSIGEPLPGMAAALVDDALARVADGEAGELCMQGPQVAPGYWRDAAQTASRFVRMPWFEGANNNWYRTGDLVARDAQGRLRYRGRKDEQVKIRGYRVELLEIEQVLKQIAGTDLVAVLAYPRTEAGATGTTAFIVGSRVETKELLERAKERLADYMVPQRVITLAALPSNANGKVDKKQLLQRLESEADADA